MVGHNVDNHLNAVGLGLLAQGGERGLRPYAARHYFHIVGQIGIEPFGVVGSVALHGRQLYGTETGLGYCRKFGADVGDVPVEEMEDVAVLDIVRETVGIGRIGSRHAGKGGKSKKCFSNHGKLAVESQKCTQK